MKHLQKLGYILIGSVITATVMFAVPAIAAQIQTVTATANTVNIALDGKQVAAKGESYKLSDGKEVPYSLSYQGTTYLPIRKVGELTGKEIYWDQTTGTAGVGVNPKAETPSNETKPTTGYSDWTAEEEKAYQEFKGMWDVSIYTSDDTTINYQAKYSGKEPLGVIESSFEQWKTDGYVARFSEPYREAEKTAIVNFYYPQGSYNASMKKMVDVGLYVYRLDEYTIRNTQ